MKDELSVDPGGKYNRYVYFFTISGYMLITTATMAIFIYQQKSLALWIALILVQIIPHFDYFMGKTWTQFEDVTKYTFVVPTIICAFFWGATGFYTPYGAIIFLTLITSLVTTIGPHIIWRIVFISVPASIIGGYFNQFIFVSDMNLPILFLHCFLIFIFLALYGVAMNSNFVYLRKIRRKLAEEKQLIERVNKIIVEASSSFSSQKIMQVILNAVNENKSFSFVSLLVLDKNKCYIYDTYGDSSMHIKHGNFKKIKSFLENHKDLFFDYFSNKGIFLYNKHILESKDLEISALISKQDLFHSILSIPLKHEDKVTGIVILLSSESEKVLHANELDYIGKFIAPISGIINNTLLHQNKENQKDLMEKKRINYENISNQLAKYLSPQVYRSLFSQGENVDISSKRKYLTILLADLVGFTKVLQSLKHVESINLLNDYLDQMTAIAMQYGATIDKYIGDNILIFFGDPESKGMEKDAIICIEMALAMRNKVNSLQAQWNTLLGIELSLRIGINSGYCNVGNFGSHHHMEYTIIGHNINLTSRIQHLAKANEILISESTYLLIHGAFKCQELGKFRAKGIAELLNIFQVVDSINEIIE